MDQMRPTLDELQEPPSSFNYSLLTFCSLDQPVLNDCGANATFMDFGLGKRLKLTPVSLNTNGLDGHLLCKITYCTTLTTLTKLRLCFLLYHQLFYFTSVFHKAKATSLPHYLS